MVPTSPTVVEAWLNMYRATGFYSKDKVERGAHSSAQSIYPIMPEYKVYFRKLQVRLNGEALEFGKQNSK